MVDMDMRPVLGPVSESSKLFHAYKNIVQTDLAQAVDRFTNDLETAASDYHRMVAKQRFLLSASDALKQMAVLCGCSGIARITFVLKTAAGSYLDDPDHRAYEEGLDRRFTLNPRDSGFLRTRLSTRANHVHRLLMNHCKDLQEFQEGSNFVKSALKFMLDLALNLPICAWDCAPCLAFEGACQDCGYGKNHHICSQPESTYKMLSRSQETLVKCLRSYLTGYLQYTLKPRALADAFEPLFKDVTDVWESIEVVSGTYD